MYMDIVAHVHVAIQSKFLRNQTLKVKNKSVELENSPKVM